MIIKAFKELKHIIVSSIALLLITIILSGCNSVADEEMVNIINESKPIEIILIKPSYEVQIQGTQEEPLEWLQLDKLRTYNEDIRLPFNELFHINTVTENGINGKSGCLFVDAEGDTNGNTTLADAFRNKVFVTKYWEDAKLKQKIAGLGLETYGDTKYNSSYQVAGALNAYYNLLPNAVDPTAFNPTQSLTREDFYTLVFKSEEGVREIEGDAEFDKAIGEATEYSKYAKEVAKYGFLDAGNKSLDGASYKGSISRAEAIYTIVNKHFAKELKSVTGKEKAYNDTKNGGDLALNIQAKVKNKDTKKIEYRDRWQSYTMAYMMQNEKKGMQEELYKAMVVAKNVGLVKGDNVRWDEPLSKAEGIMLVTNTHLAKNKLHGYETTVEYGKINVDKFMEDEKEFVVTGKDDFGNDMGEDWAETPENFIPSDPFRVLPDGRKLWELKESVESIREECEDMGLSDEIIQEELEDMAETWGSTLKELDGIQSDYAIRVIEKEKEEQKANKPVQKPSTSKPVQKPSTSKPVQKPSTNKPVQKPVVSQPVQKPVENETRDPSSFDYEGESLYDGNDSGAGKLK